MKFNQLGIHKSILTVLEKQGYTQPTPIQEKTIPSALQGRDILGLAQTGTGKTAAFAVPTLQQLSEKKSNGKIRALIVTPTRELATQINESIKIYGQQLPLRSTVIFGGVKQRNQVTALKNGVDILIATPGRLMDLVSQGYIKLSSVEVFILDEADRMLDMGFIHDIKKIIKLLPTKKQTMLFSATMPKEVDGIVKSLLVNPLEAKVTPVSSTVDRIEQTVYHVDQKNKIHLLVKFFKENPNESVLIFTRTKRGANTVVKELAKRNIEALAIHGNKTQVARQKALDSFKNEKIKALVATDIASRGIDIHELKYVINYDLPEIPETYVHRIGRTGRAGFEGYSLSLCSYQELSLLKTIEKLIKKKIKVLDNEDYPIMDKSEKKKRTQSKPARKKQVRVNEKETQEHSNMRPKRKKKNKPSAQEQAKNKKYYNKNKAKRRKRSVKES